MIETTIVVPTFNEGGNVRELTRRLGHAAETGPPRSSSSTTRPTTRQLHQVGRARVRDSRSG